MQTLGLVFYSSNSVKSISCASSRPLICFLISSSVAPSLSCISILVAVALLFSVDDKRDITEVREPAYSQVYRFIDKVHGNLIAGELTYGDYSRKVKEMNTDLKTQCTGIQIVLLPKKHLEEQLMFSTPGEFINDTELEDAIEVDAYNQGYNIC